MDGADGAAALGSGAASLGAVLLATACGLAPAATPYAADKENAGAAATRGNVPAPAGPSALKSEASAVAQGRAPQLAAEDSFDTAGCASRAAAARGRAA